MPKIFDNAFRYHKVGGHEIEFAPSDSYDDETTGYTPGDPFYYGFLASNSAWMILKVDEAAGTTRYCAGTDSYASYWAAHTSQTYVYYNQL